MKNNTPSSEFEHEDKCPSCGSPCNIHTDLDNNDECNECRNQIDSLEMGQIVPKEVNVPTALEILQKHLNLTNPKPSAILDAMIEFGTLHVEAALKEVINITHKNGIPRIIDNKDSILNAYPLTSIK